jgi:hypothetical protein
MNALSNLTSARHPVRGLFPSEKELERNRRSLSAVSDLDVWRCFVPKSWRCWRFYCCDEALTCLLIPSFKRLDVPVLYCNHQTCRFNSIPAGCSGPSFFFPMAIMRRWKPFLVPLEKYSHPTQCGALAPPLAELFKGVVQDYSPSLSDCKRMWKVLYM